MLLFLHARKSFAKNDDVDVVVFGGEKPSREEDRRRRRRPRRVAGEVVVVLRLGVLLGERCVDNTIFVDVVVVVRSKSRESRHRSSGKRPELRNKDGVCEREREKVCQLSTVFNRAIDAFKRRRVGEEFVEIEFHRASNERGWSFVRTATSQRTRENVDKHARGVADCDGRS